MATRKDQLVENEVDQLVREAGGSYIKAFKALLDREEAKAIKAQRTTVAQRKAEKRNDIEQVNMPKLRALQKKLSAVIKVITTNQIDLAPGELLTQEQKVSLMREYLDERDIAELIAVRKDEMIREIVFNHLTAEAAAEQKEDPEYQNGKIVVPELGYYFHRYGCGRKEADLNSTKLAGLLGEQWPLACDAVTIERLVIPAHVEYTLSEEKLLQLAQKDPEVYEKLLACLEVGGWKNPSFTARPIS